MDDKLNKFYNGLLGAGFTESEIGDFDVFSTNIKNPEKNRKFYDALLSTKKVTESQIGNYDTFYANSIGGDIAEPIKKKDSGSVSGEAYGTPKYSKQYVEDMLRRGEMPPADYGYLPENALSPVKSLPNPKDVEPIYNSTEDSQWQAKPAPPIQEQIDNMNVPDDLRTKFNGMTDEQQWNAVSDAFDKHIDATKNDREAYRQVNLGKRIAKQNYLKAKLGTSSVMGRGVSYLSALGSAMTTDAGVGDNVFERARDITKDLAGLDESVIRAYEDKYDPNLVVRVTSDLIPLGFDLGVFKAASGATKAVGAGVGHVSRWMVQAGMPKVVVSRGVGSFLNAAWQGAGTLGLYGGMNDITNQLINEGRELDKSPEEGGVDWGEFGNAIAKDAALGATIGVMGNGIRIAKHSLKSSRALADRAFAREASALGVDAIGLGAEGSVFAVGDAVLDRERKLEDVSWEDVLHSIGVVGGMKLAHISNRVPQERLQFKDGERLLFEDGYGDMGAKINEFKKDNSMFNKFMNDKGVPWVVRAKVAWEVNGLNPAAWMPPVRGVKYQEGSRGYEVSSLDKDGNAISTDFYKSKSAALKATDNYDFEAKLNNALSYLSQSSYEDIGLINKQLKAKGYEEGVDTPRIEDALNKDYFKRTPTDLEILNDLIEASGKVSEAGNQNKPAEPPKPKSEGDIPKTKDKGSEKGSDVSESRYAADENIGFVDTNELPNRASITDKILDYVENRAEADFNNGGGKPMLLKEDGVFTAGNAKNLLGEGARIKSVEDIQALKEELSLSRENIAKEIENRKSLKEPAEGDIRYGGKDYKSVEDLKKDLRDIGDMKKVPQSTDVRVQRAINDIMIERGEHSAEKPLSETGSTRSKESPVFSDAQLKEIPSLREEAKALKEEAGALELTDPKKTELMGKARELNKEADRRDKYIQKQKQDADKKSSTEKVAMEEQSEAGKEVREGDATEKETPTKDREVREDTEQDFVLYGKPPPTSSGGTKTKGSTPNKQVKIPVDSPWFIRAWNNMTKARKNMPKEQWDRWMMATGKIKAASGVIMETEKDFRRALKASHGNKISPELRDQYNKVLGEMSADPRQRAASLKDVPKPVANVLVTMRNQIDALTAELKRVGVIQGDLAVKMDDNLGFYLTRTYEAFKEPKKRRWDKIDDKVKNEAVDFVLSEFPDMTKDEAVAKLRAYMADKESPFSMIQSGRVGAKDMGILKQRKDVPEPIRNLLGEYKDPSFNYATSVMKMTELIEREKFLQDIKEAGKDIVFFEKEVGDAVYKIDTDSWNTFTKEGDPIYMLKEVKDALESINKSEHMPTWLRMYMKANSSVKWGKTVASPVTHARNWTANIMFHVANGRNPFGAVTQTAKEINRFFRDNMDDRAYYKRLRELGIIGEDVREGEMRDAIRDGYKNFEDFERAQDRFISKAGKAGRGVLKATNKLYQGEDAVHKIWAFEGEKRRYQKAYEEYYKDKAPEEILEMAERKAADIVRNTMPTYSLVPEIVKQARRLPVVGTFVSFPAEVMRTTYNTIDLSLREIKEPSTRAIGAQRLAGFVSAMAMTSAASALTRRLSGISKQDENDARRFMPPWSENSDLLFLGTPKNGEYRYLDIGYSDPYNYIKKPVKAVIRAHNTGEDVTESLINGIKEMAEPFIGEELLYGKLADIRSNKKKGSGSDIYNEQDPIGDRAYDMMMYLWDGVRPGVFSSAERIKKGITGEVDGGRTYNTAEEILATVAGQRIARVNPTTGFKWNSIRNNARIEGAKRIYKDVLHSDSKNITDEDRRKAWEKSNELIRDIVEDMQKDYNAAIRLGADEMAMNKYLNDGVSKVVRYMIRYDEYVETSERTGSWK